MRSTGSYSPAPIFWPYWISPHASLARLVCLFYALLHAVSYAGLDMEWKWASIWGDVLQRPFVLAGLLAMVVLLLLALTSPKAILKAIGAARWQRLHRTVYVAAWLAVLHFYWMRLGKNNLTEVFYYGFILFLLLSTRIYFSWRKNSLGKFFKPNK